MAISETSFGLGITLGGLAASTLFGVPLNDIGAGTLVCIAGVTARSMYDLRKMLKKTGKVDALKIVTWGASGLVGAPAATVGLLIFFSAVLHRQPDGMAALALFGLGFAGNDAVGPIYEKAASWLNQKFGLKINVDDDDATK
jgi:hypothetical protein